jgi:dTDP-4-dehydrorhamnose reductase
MLAQDLIPVLSEKYQVYAVAKNTLDISNSKDCESAVYGIRPDIVVNCAAFTKVDECEINPICYDVNSLGVYNLACASKKVGARLVHFSTDYVFDGSKPTMYSEDEPRNPINAYGKSKMLGEVGLEAVDPHALNIRVQWLFGHAGNNFVKTMLKIAQNNKEIKVVADQFGRPTNTALLARSVVWLIKQGAEGKWHLASNNFCSWYEFAKEILKNHPVQVIPCTSDEFPRPAKRPKNGVLDITKAQFNGVALHPWQDHLGEYIRVIE